MSNQIGREHNRLLDQYERELEAIDRALESDIEAVRAAKRNGTRFYPRHKMLEFADFIQDFNSRMKVFDQFQFEPKE